MCFHLSRIGRRSSQLSSCGGGGVDGARSRLDGCQAPGVCEKVASSMKLNSAGQSTVPGCTLNGPCRGSLAETAPVNRDKHSASVVRPVCTSSLAFEKKSKHHL